MHFRKVSKILSARKTIKQQLACLQTIPSPQINKLYLNGHITKARRDKIFKVRIAKLQSKVTAIDKKAETARQEAALVDPFWFFEPNTGILGKREKDFLAEFLKPEDIPDRVDGQDQAIFCTSPEIGIAGGNGSAKTTSTIMRILIQSTGAVPFALQGKFPEELLPKKFPQRWRHVGECDAQLADTIYPRYKQWVPRQFLKNSSWDDSFSSKFSTLHLTKGKQEIASIQFKTNKQDVETFQGPDLDGIGYDEETRSDIYDENLQRFRAADRINIIHGWTPTKGLSWQTDLFEGCGPDSHAARSLFMLCTATNKVANFDNLRIIFNKVKEKNSYDVLKMRLLGEFISLSGLVYGQAFNRSIHVIPPFYEHIPKEDRYANFITYSGWDPHTVTATAGVFVLVDREGICYVDRCYSEQADTEQIKNDFHLVKNYAGYRMGWSAFDKSCDSNMVVFGGRNIFLELTRGKNAIPAGKKSAKFTGSINTGVDNIIKRLRAAAIMEGAATGQLEEKPLYIVDRPENRPLINSFRTLERDVHANEDLKGEKDAIREGKHHLHAALRYIFQNRVHWLPAVQRVPDYVAMNERTNY